MAKKKRPKFYVVWSGREVGVFDTWDDCAKQTAGFAGAKFKAFPSRAAAEAAFIDDAGAHVDYAGGKAKEDRPAGKPAPARPVDYPTGPALCVDAACDTTRWTMECRGVWLGDATGVGGGRDGEEAFAFGPFADANGNLGEFLALATALRLAAEAGAAWTVFCDSVTAMAWARKKVIRSVFLEDDRAGPEARRLVEDALDWLKANTSPARVVKWDTPRWGEIPADYGRK